MFDFISSSSKRLSILIDDLLTFANSGTFSKSTNIKIELKTIINTVIDNLNTIISSKNAHIETIGDFPIIKINPTAITVLLQNFINNSIKFTHSDIKPVIKISSEILNNKFLIYITDNGLGIPKEDIEKIFTPFGRSLRTKEIEGSGLGLATCLKIVKSYNGEINVEDNSKTGSTFTIIFPLDLLDEEISLKS